jgi:hypothetical protein
MLTSETVGQHPKGRGNSLQSFLRRTKMAAKKADKVEGLLMPKASAVWLVDNTALTFDQIATFTGLSPLEVQALADGDVGRGIQGRDPVRHGEVTQDELDKANADSSYNMILATNNLPPVKARSKGPRYTPVSKRGDKPDAVSYLLKHHSELSDAQICKLVGTTKPTVNAIRERTHANISNIKPRHPVDLGLCTYAELEAASDKGYRAQGKDPEEMKRQKEEALKAATPDVPEQTTSSNPEDKFAGFDFSNFVGSGGKSEDDEE